MLRNNEYPIVYAPMEVFDEANDKHGFIVSKAYLVGQSFKYDFNKKPIYSYEVVFPYFQALDAFYLEYPDMDKYNNYMNSDRVDEIFLDFEECKSYVDRLNIRTVDEYDNIDQYMQYNDRFEGIERMINSETKSLRLGRKFKIPSMDGKEKEVVSKGNVKKQLDNIVVPTRNKNIVLKKKLS